MAAATDNSIDRDEAWVIDFVRGSPISGALAIGGSIRQPITVC